MYENGKGVLVDCQKALDYLLLAADQEQPGQSNLQNKIGTFYILYIFGSLAKFNVKEYSMKMGRRECQ